MSDNYKTGISVLQISYLFGAWAIVQVALKLVGAINWSWWLVTRRNNDLILVGSGGIFTGVLSSASVARFDEREHNTTFRITHNIGTAAAWTETRSPRIWATVGGSPDVQRLAVAGSTPARSFRR